MNESSPHTFRLSLPGEILAQAWLCAMAITGGVLSESAYYMALTRTGENSQWFGIIWAVGCFGIITASWELISGRGWDRKIIRWVAFARMWANVTGIGAWVYMAITVFDAGKAGQLSTIIFGLVIFGAFHLWAALMCKRAYIILCPDTKTKELEARLAKNSFQRG